MINKVVIGEIHGNPQNGIGAQFVVITHDEQFKTAGSFNITLSHPEISKQILGLVEKAIVEILENQGFIDTPDITIVSKQ